MANIIKVQLDDINGVLYQWDTGQRLMLIGVEAGCRVDFIGGSGEPLCVESYTDGDGVYADVPNILLQYAGWVKVLVYVTDAATGETVSEKTLRVLPRTKPSDYVYTETEVKTWDDLSNRLDDLSGESADLNEQVKSLKGQMNTLNVSFPVPSEENVGQVLTAREGGKASWAAPGGGTQLPEYTADDAGKVLMIGDDGNLCWVNISDAISACFIDVTEVGA